MRNFNKKALAVTLAAVLGALSVSPAISLAADSGDINSDSSVNNNDIALLSDYILTKGYSASNADLTGDKNVDVFDLCALRDAVNNPQTPSQPSNGIKDYGTEMNANATMVADFRKGATHSSSLLTDGKTAIRLTAVGMKRIQALQIICSALQSIRITQASIIIQVLNTEQQTTITTVTMKHQCRQ